MHTISADQVEVAFYTDPLCCWSWAWEPHRLQLAAMLGEKTKWQLIMGGLIPDWTHYRDEVNSILRPSQMGPIWMHAGQIAGRSIAHQLWHTNPPATSYPACIAIKCAQLQGDDFGFEFLFILRIQAMERGQNIAKKEVIVEAGHMLADKNPLFNSFIFENDFVVGNGHPLFRADLDAVAKPPISRFPSIMIRANSKTILNSGYREAITIFNAIKNIAPLLIDCTSLSPGSIK